MCVCVFIVFSQYIVDKKKKIRSRIYLGLFYHVTKQDMCFSRELIFILRELRMEY